MTIKLNDLQQSYSNAMKTWKKPYNEALKSDAAQPLTQTQTGQAVRQMPTAPPAVKFPVPLRIR